VGNLNHLPGHQPRGVISTTHQGSKSTNSGPSTINGAGNKPLGGKSTKWREKSQNCGRVSTSI